MSQITIRKLNPEVKERIYRLAQINGRSMEGQIRTLLTEAVGLGAEEKISVRKHLMELVKNQVKAY